MDPQLKKQIERYVLKALYPNAPEGYLSKLADLAARKCLPIVLVPERSLDNLLCSILRHQDTQYDQAILIGLSKENARGLIQPVIKQALEQIKG